MADNEPRRKPCMQAAWNAEHQLQNKIDQKIRATNNALESGIIIQLIIVCKYCA